MNNLCGGCKITREDFDDRNATCRHERSVYLKKEGTELVKITTDEHSLPADGRKEVKDGM